MTLRWTRTPPTEAGYYWLRKARIQGQRWEKRVYDLDGPSTAYVEGGDVWITSWEDSGSLEDFIEAEWAGPIPPPVDAAKADVDPVSYAKCLAVEFDYDHGLRMWLEDTGGDERVFRYIYDSVQLQLEQDLAEAAADELTREAQEMGAYDPEPQHGAQEPGLMSEKDEG